MAVQRLVGESLRAEQEATDVAASEGFVLKRGRNEEQLRLFWIEHGHGSHPLEHLESLARREILGGLIATVRHDRAEEIVMAVLDGDERREERLRGFRAQLATQKGRNRDRVSKWRKRAKK
jgi:hypothetical protein